MRFLIDAQLPIALARFIRQQGDPAIHVADIGMAAAEDSPIWDRSLKSFDPIGNIDRSWYDPPVMTLMPSPLLRSKSKLPTDADALHELAERLNGRPVPGVRMTERQFVDWSEPAALPAEWVNGEVILMGTPSVAHQLLSGWLYRILIGFVELHDLGLILMPLTARLADVRARRDPDLLFVAKHRLHLLRENHFEGPPDLAVEIVSPDSVVRDWRTKHAEYPQAGVREYWVVDPLTRRFEMYVLRAKQYRQVAEDDDGRVHSKLLKGLFVRPNWLWQSPLPNVAAVLKEMGV